MRSFLEILLAATLFTMGGCKSEPHYPDMKSGKYVHDFADKIGDDLESQLETKLKALEDESTIELAVVTVTSLDGEDPAAYASELGRRWGVGQKRKDNGVLFLWALEEREVFIAVGYGLEDKLTDADTKIIVDQTILARFKQKDFDGGVIAGVDHLIAKIHGQPYTDSGGSGSKSGMPWWAWVLVIIVLIVLLAVLVPHIDGGGYYSSGSSSGGWGDSSSGGGGGGSGGGGDFGGGGAGGGY